METVAADLLASAAECLDHCRGRAIPAGALARALAGRALPSVRSLVYHCNFATRKPGLPLDDLAELFRVLPNLERVDASGPFRLSDPSHAALRELHLDGSLVEAETIAALGTGDLPALTTLGLELPRHDDLGTMPAAAIRSLAAPRLAAIQVTGLGNVTAFLAALARSPLPASWTLLYASGDVPDEDDFPGRQPGRATSTTTPS